LATSADRQKADASMATESPGEKVSCWPAPEDPENENTRQLGNLGLSDEEENAIVAFLKTLSDGYSKDTS
jgi:cytochrome c peroxidase